MSRDDFYTLISLFHSTNHAQQTLSDLQHAGVPPAQIQVLSSTSTLNSADYSATSSGVSDTAAYGTDYYDDLRQFDLSESDLKLLTEGIRNGGTVIVVSTTDELHKDVEHIFGRHDAGKVDEHSSDDERSPVGVDTLATADTYDARSSTGDIVVPVVEEQLAVGRRQVSGGGIRVYQRVVETPVEEQIRLREERATVERRPVNRPLTGGDRDAFSSQKVEIVETAEEPIVSKTARVVEEVIVGKDVSDRKQRVEDSVRRTEVEVERLDASDLGTKKL